MNVITTGNNLEVRVAASQELLNYPAKPISYRTGSLKTAKHSAIKDIEAGGEGYCFKIIKTYPSGNTDTIACGEFMNSRYYPRNNF